MSLLEIYALLKPELDRIEEELARSIRSDLPLLSETSLHLLQAGGKRIRPVFVLLAGRFGTNDPDKIIRVAVALELIHMASLVHDDVIDDAEIRRGRLTVRSRWDNRIAMYTGDYIYAKALTVIGGLEQPRIHQVLSGAMVQMCIGEIEQIRDFFNTGQSIRRYLRRIRRKTALLIAVSCLLGALAAEAPPAAAAALYRYGYNAGMAFQITDDLLDLLGSEAVTGKPPGSDLRQGNLTLPVLYALQESGIREPLLAEIGRLKDSGGSDVSAAIRLVRQSGGIRRSEALADRYVGKALAALERLPEGPAKEQLTEIARFIARRNY